MKIINSLLKYDTAVKKVDINPYSDVGEMTKEEFALRKENATIIDSENYLTNRIMGI